MITSVTVVVPARDEQDEIGGCLSALAVARAQLHDRRRVPVDVVVVLDDCRDGTAAVVAGFPDVHVRTALTGSVGAARRIGAAGLPAGPHHWLASTDADCRVPADWLLRMVAHADAGADLVLGTVRPSAAGLSEAVRRAWVDAHCLVDGHRHVHGANLGIRASTYLAAGGWAPLSSSEDVELVRCVERDGHARVRRCGDLAVETSSRLQGRAPNGFAAYLAQLAAGMSWAPTG